MDIFGAIASIWSCLCPGNVVQESVCYQCKHLKNPRMEIEKLREKSKELNALVEDVNRKLEEDGVKYGKEPKLQVKVWLEQVQKYYTSQVTDLVDESWEEKRCFHGCAPNYCSRLKLGELIKNKINETTELLEKGKFPDDSLADFVLERGKTLPTIEMMRDATTERTLGEIWKWIMAVEVGRIGVYGMGGVGKTTIMEDIHNSLLNEKKTDKSKSFDSIFWVTVSKDSTPEKLQSGIARKVGLHLSDDWDKMDVTERKCKLFATMKQRKRFVLILDDVWQKFSLDEIGIPTPTKDNGCKLILTTRKASICQSMETDEQVEVKVLSKEESWKLFSSKVGSRALADPEIEKIAKEVAKECGGLPLALVTVGIAFRNKNVKKEWENELMILRGLVEDMTDIQMEDDVYPRLRFSYERLKDDTTRSCFLYCALYPEDWPIEAKKLIEYWIWEGLLGDVRRIQDKILKGERILKELKDSCMLENASEDASEHVKMHDLIRDMAIHITHRSPRCVIKAGKGLVLAPSEDVWIGDAERISLMHNRLKSLQGDPNCPELSCLLLQGNSLAENISHPFFGHMHNLKVLDLSYTEIELLPDSISDLQNLRALLLCHCQKLTHLCSLEKLKALRVLDLSYTNLKELPPEMKMLCNLRRLDLSNSEVEMFPAALLSTLTLLEELLMYRCKVCHDLEFVDALINSKSIVVLEVEFSNIGVLDKYLRSGHWNNLQSWILSVGWRSWSLNLEKPHLIDIKGNFLLDGAPILLPDCTTEFELSECNDINRLSMCIPRTAMQLRMCHIMRCDQIECVILDGENNLNSLEVLWLFCLDNLRTICQGVVARGTFVSLKKMNVSFCGCLKSLFTPGLCKYLENLEGLSVYDCPQMEVIIEEDSGVDSITGPINFPKLQKLHLSKLEKLQSIYIKGCSNLKRLPIKFLVENTQQQTSIITPPLTEIGAEREWWDSVHFDYPEAKTVLQQIVDFKAVRMP